MKRVLLVLVVLSALTAGGGWWWARGSLPPLDGEQTVVGLAGPVEVLFDGHGVPHVYAAGPEDAWFAAGVLHARDRLWQMELYRRAAYGRLSEILGAQTLPIDRRLLTLGLGASAEAEWASVPTNVREALTRYAAGVNAVRAGATGRRRPLEMQVLGLTPAEWRPVDSLAVGRLLAWRLGENHQAELIRQALATRFGSDEAFRLAGRYPGDAPTIVQGAGGETASVAAAAAPPAEVPAATPDRAANTTAALARERVWPVGLEWLDPSARRGNSNNWVLSGRRTASRRPLLANDPHLQLEMPGVWYEMHLVAAGLDVIGVTIPGAPFVIIGHNARIAWGLTNSGADVQDLYVERLDLQRRQYFYRGQWLPVQVEAVQIPVRGESAQPFEIWRTRHGPIFADVGLDWDTAPDWLTPGGTRTGERRAYALRWGAAQAQIATGFEALDRAGSWEEFLTAIERFGAPSQNVVYADVEGNIGYALSGQLPIRASGVGMVPSSGPDGEGEWTGAIDARLLPRVLNPPAGYLTSSNNQVDRRWPGLITRDWAAPYRTMRLHALISSAERADVTAAAAWQNDIAGLSASDILNGSAAAIASAKSRNAASAVVATLEQLNAWDRQIDGRPVVTLFHMFEDALWRRTFFDEMGAPLFARFYEWAGAERPAGLYAIINDPQSRWFDDIGTLERRETRDDIFALAAADAADRFAAAGQPAWSETHAARFDHPLSSGGWPLRWMFNRGPSPIGGGMATVMRTSYHRLRPFAAWEIASWRQIFDVGAWDESRVVLPAGQSGHPLSPYYFDQNDLWRHGQYRVQPFSRARVEAARVHRLLLLP